MQGSVVDLRSMKIKWCSKKIVWHVLFPFFTTLTKHLNFVWYTQLDANIFLSTGVCLVFLKKKIFFNEWLIRNGSFLIYVNIFRTYLCWEPVWHPNSLNLNHQLSSLELVSCNTVLGNLCQKSFLKKLSSI